MKPKHLILIAVLALPLAAAAFALAGGGVGDACWLGMTVENLSAREAAQMGLPTAGSRVVVVKVDRAALAAGIVARDVLLGVNGKPVDSIATFLDQARAAAGGQVADVVVTVSRFGRTVMITIPSETIGAFGTQ